MWIIISSLFNKRKKGILPPINGSTGYKRTNYLPACHSRNFLSGISRITDPRQKISGMTKVGTIILLFSLTCVDVDGINRKNKSKEKTDFIFLYLAQNRAKGNCLRKETSTSTAYCDRRSSGICNANDLILTSAEKTFNLSEGNDLVKAVPTCNFSFFNSGIASDTVSTFSQQDFILGNNSYSVVSSCEDTGISSSASLVSESELLFTNSPRGRIGVAADKIVNTLDSILTLTLPPGTSATQIKSDASLCLNGGFTQSEKDLISDLRTSKRVKAITCSTKSGSTNACPF